MKFAYLIVNISGIVAVPIWKIKICPFLFDFS